MCKEFINIMKNLFFSLIAFFFINNFVTLAQDCSIKVSGKESKWDKIDPLEVARLHNEYLKQSLLLLNDNPKLTEGEILKKLEIPTLTVEAQTCIVDHMSKVSLQEMNNVIINNFENANSVSLFNELNGIVSKSLNYDDLVFNLGKLRDRINNTTKGKDRDVLLTCLETGIASAQIWFTKDEGGTGLGTSYLTSHSLVGKPGERTRLQKDLAGAGYGMVFWSFSAFLGPVSGAGFLYGAISGAVSGSFFP